MKPIRNVLCIIVDFASAKEAVRLSLQIAEVRKTLRALDTSTEIHILHVDNGNSQSIQLTPEQIKNNIKLFRCSENNGYAGGIRSAISAVLNSQVEGVSSNIDAYWFLNSDLEVAPDCLGTLLKTLNSDSKVGAVGPTVFWGHSSRVWGARGVVDTLFGLTAMTAWPQGGELPRWSYIPGSSLLIRREAYEQVGGLPSIYRMYYEETELCVRLQVAGWKLVVEPNAKAYHHVYSMKGGVPAKHFAFYFIRNNFLFWKRNFNRSPWRQLPSTLWVFFREIVLPLRKTSSLKQAAEVLRVAGAGLLDGWRLAGKNLENDQVETPRESRWFKR